MPWRAPGLPSYKDQALGLPIQGVWNTEFCLQKHLLRDPRKLKAVLLSFGQKGESKLVILNLASLISLSLSHLTGSFSQHEMTKLFLQRRVIIVAFATIIRSKNVFHQQTKRRIHAYLARIIRFDAVWSGCIFFSNKHYSLVHSKIIAMLAGFYNPIIFVCEHKF